MLLNKTAFLRLALPKRCLEQTTNKTLYPITLGYGTVFTGIFHFIAFHCSLLHCLTLYCSPLHYVELVSFDCTGMICRVIVVWLGTLEKAIHISVIGYTLIRKRPTKQTILKACILI